MAHQAGAYPGFSSQSFQFLKSKLIRWLSRDPEEISCNTTVGLLQIGEVSGHWLSRAAVNSIFSKIVNDIIDYFVRVLVLRSVCQPRFHKKKAWKTMTRYSETHRNNTYSAYCHNVPTRGLLAVETKNSFVLWLANLNIRRIVYKQWISLRSNGFTIGRKTKERQSIAPKHCKQITKCPSMMSIKEEKWRESPAPVTGKAAPFSFCVEAKLKEAKQQSDEQRGN